MGKSSSQVVGYRYYAKFAAFIGNRIEKLIGINFDNRKWVIHDPLKHPPNLLPVLEGNLFGENEGGVSGNVDIHFGYPNQEPNTEYQKYFPLVSGYPYQSYLVFRSLTGGAPSLGEGLSPAGFYLGNSGYMKEMLLWVKRIYVRNDGSPQWYQEKAGIPDLYTEISGFVRSNLNINAKYTAFEFNIPKEYEFNAVNQEAWNKSWSVSGIVDTNRPLNYPYPISQVWTIEYSSLDSVFIELTVNIMNNDPLVKAEILLNIAGDIDLISIDDWDEDSPQSYGRGQFKRVRAVLPPTPNGKAILSASGKLEAGMVSWHRGQLKWSDPTGGEGWLQDMNAMDINPIHKIREILTDDTAMNKPESDVNNVNFAKAADRIWDERLGISWAIDEKSCIEAIEELCYHIEAGIRVNRQTGLYEIVLFRDDWFSDDEVHDIAENKIKDLSLEVMNSDDIVNQLNVTYYDRQRIKNSTFSVYENGSILTMGHANAESVEFPYFMNMRNAEIVTNWKLKQFSTPAWSGSFTTGWREARKWNRYDLIRLPWSKKWNGTILVRIMKINLGDGVNNTVAIDFEEVIPYSGEMNTSIVVDNPVDSGPKPPQPSVNAVFEAPYYLTALRAGQTNTDLELSNNPDIGYVAAIAAKPQNNSLNALLYTDGGIGEFEQVSRLDYCDILQLDQQITETTSSFTVTGSLTQIANSNNLILLNDELMGFMSLDNETKVLTVKRGVLDTVPKKHSSGSLFVFDLPDVAFDLTQYTQSEIIETQVLTTTPSGVQELSETGQSIEIQARAIRPYPPANVKINGVHYPKDLGVTNALVITWVHRNRVQQTGGTVLGYFDAGVTAENGITYQLTISEIDTDGVETPFLDLDVGLVDTYTVNLASMLSTTKKFRVILYSKRDAYTSFQEFNFIVGVAYSAPYNLLAEYVA
ncbi:hypothetical protein [Acinetobacter lwoffii]|uniref:hypothetical protein n=1 Tax=Acinetobacter lwoffii TaxID=28090 RepID=UPI0035BC6D4C|nr:hypothetical protein ABEDC_1060 [Acinetobacter lwoffii]